jgi:hypothetical protein
MFILFIWAYDLSEKPHVHIRKGKSKTGIAKIWIDNQEVAEAGDFNEKDLNMCKKFISDHQAYFSEQLDLYRNGVKIKFKTFN